MRLTIQSQPLLRAIEIASHAQQGKAKLPVLSNALIQCWPDKVTVIGDNLDSRVECDFEPDSVDDRHCVFCVSPRMLRAALRSDSASIELDKHHLIVKSGGESKLMVADAKEFPKPWREIEAKPVDGKTLVSALRQTSHCAASGSKKMVFWSEDTQHMVGFASSYGSFHRLEMPHMGSFLFGCEQARSITQIFDWEEDVRIGHLHPDLFLQQGVVRAWFKLYEPKLPMHAELLAEPPIGTVFEREPFVKSLEGLSAFADPEYQKITITPSKNGWKASTISINGESEIELAGSGLSLEENLNPFVVSLGGFLDTVKFWSSDTISLHRQPNFIVLRPQSDSGFQSGAQAIINLIRS